VVLLFEVPKGTNLVCCTSSPPPPVAFCAANFLSHQLCSELDAFLREACRQVKFTISILNGGTGFLQQAYWPFHKEWCTRNDFADLIEKQEPKFAKWMRKHGKQAVLKDGASKILHAALVAPSGLSHLQR
jgi:hypothetical protein